MAKKKTAGADDPTAKSATRRRSAKTIDTSSSEAAPGPAAAIDGTSSESLGSSTPSSAIAVAADMSSGYSPSYEEIAEAAYHRYLSRGGQHGGDWDDWIEAERELRSRK
jgi:hypothetical protein